MIQFKRNNICEFIILSNKWKNDKSYLAYLYCKNVKDREEVRKLIKESDDAYYYCRDVKDRPEVRKLITESFWKQKYLNWKNNK